MASFTRTPPKAKKTACESFALNWTGPSKNPSSWSLQYHTLKSFYQQSTAVQQQTLIYSECFRAYLTGRQQYEGKNSRKSAVGPKALNLMGYGLGRCALRTLKIKHCFFTKMGRRAKKPCQSLVTKPLRSESAGAVVVVVVFFGRGEVWKQRTVKFTTEKLTPTVLRAESLFGRGRIFLWGGQRFLAG